MKRKKLTVRLVEQEEDLDQFYGVVPDDGSMNIDKLIEEMQDLLSSIDKGSRPSTDAIHAAHQILELLQKAQKSKGDDDPGVTQESLRRRLKRCKPRTADEQYRLLMD